MNPNTELCVDLKTLLFNDRRAMIEKPYDGTLVRDRKDHFVFTESMPEPARKPHPKVYVGKHITVSRWPDGSLHPNFRTMDARMPITKYAKAVCKELVTGLRLSGVKEVENER